MARGYNAGESRGGSQASESNVGSIFENAIGSYFGKGSKYGAGETATATSNRPSWMPKADELSSSLNPDLGKTFAANEDASDIMRSIPKDIGQQLDRVYEILYKKAEAQGNQNENGVNTKANAELENKLPEVFEALKEITYRKAFARSSSIKSEIAENSKDDQFKDMYETAMKAATKAFNTADEVAKSVLKRGDDTYGESREFRGLARDGFKSMTVVEGSNESKEQTFSLKVGEPGLSGRVLAVNAGILAARSAAEKVITDLSKQYAKVNMKVPQATADDVRRLVMQKMVSDKHAFLAVKGYIPKTSIYIGPGANGANPVATINPTRGTFRSAPLGAQV
jgi:hypothetical protein